MTHATTLSPAVINEVVRLGGQWAPLAGREPAKIEGHAVPAAMDQFLSVRWPKQQRYGSDENSDVWVWMLEFGYLGWVDPEEIEIQDRGDRPLIYFALADGGNYFLLLDLDDPHPSDPQVYKVDHSDPDQRLYASATLSEFLRELNPEEKR